MSRKISQLAAEAFISGKEFSRSGHGQTQVVKQCRYVSPQKPNVFYFQLLLHGNCIARLENETLSITTAGWNTVTTRERLNALPGVFVNVYKGILYLNDKQWDGAWIEI